MSEIKKVPGKTFVRDCMFKYGMEVIENRALPRIEDGLKPVQRLTLWAMREFNTDHFIVSAQLAGKTTGSYSPHSEGAPYEAMVGMVQDRYAAVEGQGGFGGIGTDAAAPRYTKARLSEFMRKISTDLPDMKVVPYCPNYDETLEQPVYLPTAVPYLLLNGSEGIAVGISTKIPAFNLQEVCRAVLKHLGGDDASQACKQIKGPDGFDCTLLSSKKEIRALIESGEGTLEYQCKYVIEKGRRNRLIVQGYCPEFTPAAFLSRCSRLQDDDVIDAARNESSAATGPMLVVEYKDASVFEKRLLPLLRRKVSYRINVLFDRKDGLKPEMCGLPKIIESWTKIRKQQIGATLKMQADEIGVRIGREQAKLKAVLNLKEVFAALESKGDFKQALVEKLGFTPDEAQMIAEMRVEALKRANKVEIEERIGTLDRERAAILERAKDVGAVMREQIESILEWAKKKEPGFLARMTELEQT